ncbi:Response regulator receiver domain-containing protein [Ruminococcaceae bacterium YRB3002]|nr:Response regulator receiver domain-containing protein [Ruminococcaceae bacterium YRB3002]
MNFVTIDDYEHYSDLIIKYVTEGVSDVVDSVEFEKFSSAEDFLEFLDENPDYKVDILFCDVEMGGMSGVDLAEHIRRHYQYGSRIMKMIFVTSYRKLWIEYDGQIVGKISKPFEKSDIVSAVMEMM